MFETDGNSLRGSRVNSKFRQKCVHLVYGILIYVAFLMFCFFFKSHGCCVFKLVWFSTLLIQYCTAVSSAHGTHA